MIEGGQPKTRNKRFRLVLPDAQSRFRKAFAILAKLGNESVQRKFFSHCIKEVANVSGEVVIDSTGLENEIDIPLTEYSGRTGDMATKLKYPPSCRKRLWVF